MQNTKNILNFRADDYQPMFWNVPLDKGRLKSFVSWFLKNYGERKTLQFLEQLKILGFGYATKAGISLGIEDLKIPPIKPQLLGEAELVVSESLLKYRKGEITGIEKMQLFIETWNETSETLKQEVVRYFEKTDILNPVYMMAFSGARGNLSQVRQLVGMRGLMSDPQGKIIDFPIQSNFREGLTLTEYLISTYGARKGIVDTALRTATAGYLTRRLVDVAQHVIVSKFDCGSQRGIFLFDMKEGIKTIYSFQNRLTGRVLAQDIEHKEENQISKIAYRNQEITSELAEAICKVTKKALVRSPLTCETKKLVCQLCYGWSLGTSRLVSIGETVGVIAGQSIGEPGTQLTMRTFHTGGVFSANITQQINAPFAGIVEYAHPIAGTCVRTPLGNSAFLTKASGILFLKKYNEELSLQNMSAIEKQNHEPILTNTYKIPAFTILFARHGEFVTTDSILAQISALPTGQNLTQTIEQTIYSSLEGEVYYNHIDLLEDIDEKYGERISKAEDWSKVWVLSAKISNNSLFSSFFPKQGDLLSTSSIVNQIEWILPSSQKSVLDIQNSKSLKGNLTEYSAVPKNQALSRSNLEKFEPLLSNESKVKPFVKKATQMKNSGFKNFQISTSLNSENSKIQICSKYKIKTKFLKQNKIFEMNDLSATNYFKTNKTNPLNLIKKYNSTNLNAEFFARKSMVTLPTEFNYPYNAFFRSQFSQVLKQTFVSLPILRPGILSKWLKSEISTNQHKKKTVLDVKNTDSFVKKLNMNPKFRAYNVTKPNFFHPLILANSVPFTLQVKTIKHWLSQYQQGQKARHLYFTNMDLYKNNKEKLLNTNTDSTKNNKMEMNTLKLKFQTSKNQFLKLEKQNFKSTRFVNRDASEFHKFDTLFMKTPLLRFKAQNLQYRRFGYFISIPLNSNQTDQFFTLLPLKKNSFGSARQDNLVQQNSKATNFDRFNKNLQRSQKLNAVNLTGLKNSDQWTPKPTNSFYWLPKAFQISNNAIFWVSNPTHSQKAFQQKLLDLKTLKTTFVDTKKSLEKLNVAQSQTFKKPFAQANKKSHVNKFPFKFSKKFKQKAKIPFLSECFKTKTSHTTYKNGVEFFPSNGFVKNSMENKGLTLLSNESKGFFKFKPYQKHLNVNLNKFVWLKKFKSSLLSNKNILQKSENLKFQKFRKCVTTTNPFETKEDLKKFNDFKTTLIAKKESFEVKTRNFLTLKLNLNQKVGVPFTEIFYLPQETYTLNTTTCQTNSKMKSSFISKNNQASQTSENVQFYLTNLQGVKKPFTCQNEGYLKLNYFQHSQGENLKYMKKIKKYPNFLRQNFVLNSKSFKSLPVKNLPKEELLKVQFLNYLQSSKFVKKQNLTQTHVSEKPTFNFSNKFVYANPKHSSQFFTFVPFIRKTKNLTLLNGAKNNGIPHSSNQPFNKLAQSYLNQKVEKTKTKFVNLNLKPGWIYKTNNLSQLLYCHKTMLDKGQIVLDDISFETHKVFLEVVPLKPTISSFSIVLNKEKVELENEKFKKFEPSRFIKNPKPRFLNPKEKLKTNFDKFKTSETDSSFVILVRPFSHKILPSPLQMKTNLYKFMKETKFKEFETSYFLYKQYFSSEFNCQSNKFKTLSNFAPMDVSLETLETFPLTNLTVQTKLNVFSNKRKQLFGKKRGKVNLPRKKTMSWYFCSNFLMKSSSKKQISPQNKQKIYKMSLGLTKSSELLNSTFLKNQHFYFSNYPLNIGSCKVFYQNSSTNPFDLSIGKLSIKLNSFENSLFKKLKKTNIENQLKNNYLNILIHRKTKETHLQKPQIKALKKNLSLNAFENSYFTNGVLKKQKFIPQPKVIFLNGTSIKSFLKFVEDIPFFEYSVQRQYNFFANQRLFASTFYKHQFHKSLKVNLLNDYTFLQENFRNKKYIQHYLNKNAFAESFYHYPISKNEIVFDKENFSNPQTLGFTNFYSSFEGEVLKDYSKEPDLHTLKKGFNINLDKSHLMERQGQQLILTKSDFFSVPLNKLLFSLTVFRTKKNISNFMFSDRKSKNAFFETEKTKNYFQKIFKKHKQFQILENTYFTELDLKKYEISDFTTTYDNKNYKLKTLNFGIPEKFQKLRLGHLMSSGDKLYSTAMVLKPGQIIHFNSKKLTLRKAEFFSISPRAILHSYNGHCVMKNAPVMTLPYETLKTGDIVQGIPKVEQYLEARTTIQGRLFLNSLPVLLYAIYQRYSSKLNMQNAVRQSFLKIQQILVDGIQRVYRSQGVSIADKHLEIIVRQMTSKVKIIHGGQTGFFAGELVDLEFVERINTFLMVKVRYEPVVLGITRASLEVDSFLSASSFQQTTKVLTRAAMENKKDFLKGLKENLLVGNLLPAGTGYVLPISR